MTRVGWRKALGLIPLLALVGACSCGDGGGTSSLDPRLKWSLELDPTGRATYLVDFGPVPVGATAVREIMVENVGSSSLRLSTHLPSPPFSLELEEGLLEVGVGGKRPVSFGFSPTEVEERPRQIIVTFSTNEPDARTHTVRLVGQGVLPSLECEPGPVDFGKVLKGATRTRAISCTNPLSTPLLMAIEGFKGNARSAFSAAVPGASGAAVEIPAKGTVGLEISFKADLVGVNDASLSLRDENNQLLAQIEVRAETVTSALQVEPALCMEFDYVGLGASKRKSLQVRNIGTKDLRIVAFELSGGGGEHFEVVSPLPIPLPADEETVTEIVIEFHPSEGGAHSAQIEIRAEDSDSTPMSATACVSGFGGGPRLVCNPAAIDFGMVAVGIPMTNRFSCINDGYEPPGSSIDNLFVTGLSSDAGAFEASIRNRDGSTGPLARGYAAGEGFSVEVVYAPAEEGFDAGTIRVESTAAEEGAALLGVSGQGRRLPPCDFSITPPRLDFGVVDRGQELELAFGIQNNQETACLIHDLRLSEGSDPAYSVGAIQSYELAGFETLRVPVTFAPQSYAPTILGEVHFQISNEAERDQVVPLSGISAEACILVEPSIADFGRAEPGCNSRQQILTVKNVCRKAAVIKTVEVSDTLGSDQFKVALRPILPKRLELRERDEIGLIFTPTALGAAQGAVAIEVEGPTPDVSLFYLATLVGEGTDNVEQTDTFQQREPAKVDILWVMDNSGSFDAYQERISENLPAFLTYANEKGIDWQIAVTTTGLTRAPAEKPSNDCPGGAQGGEDGRFFPIDGSHPRILDRRTQDIEAHWRHNMLVGTCHSDELPLEAGKRALSEPLISLEKDARYPASGFTDGNAGFLRPEADLSIIFVTDEVDHSPQLPASYLAFFRSIKGEDSPERLRIHAITGPTYEEGWKSCEMVEYGDRIMNLVDATEGTWLNICTPINDKEEWKRGLVKMSEAAFGGVNRFVLRGFPASRTGASRATEKDIEVRINGKVQAPMVGTNQAWRYDPISNAIDFTPFFTPQAGAQITASYKVKCLKE